MLLPVFGSAGAMTTFALQVVSALAETIAGPHQVIHANTTDDFSKAWQDRQSDNIIVLADVPDAELADTIRQSGLPFAVFIETGDSLIESIWEATSIDPSHARGRLVSIAALHDLILSPAAKVVCSDDRTKPARLLARIADHYRMPATEEQISQTLSRLGMADRPENTPILSITPVPIPEGAVPDERWRQHIADAFSGFAPLLEQQRVDRLSWPPPFFLASIDGKPGPLTGPIDLTGPARTIIWGPYVSLPPGRWLARPTFACSRNTAGCRMSGDIYSNIVHANWETILPEEGAYFFDIPFEVVDPRQGIEMRFFLKEGVIDGIFELQEVKLSRLE